MTGDVNLTHIRDALDECAEGIEWVRATHQCLRAEAVIQAARDVAWFKATREELRERLAALEDGQ